MATQIAEIVDVQQYLSQQLLNVTHWVDPTGLLDIADLVADYKANVVPLIAAIQVPGCAHTDLRYRIVTAPPSLILDEPISPPVVGTNGTIGADSCDALSIKWTLGAGTVVLAGGFTGHIRRGGHRIGGYEADGTVQNTVSAGFITLVRTYTNELLTSQGGGWLLCVASFLDGARVRQPDAQAFALVTAASDPGASTQNTRKFLRGRSS
jgi:hypothetical protein